jgi:hypothetical protein
MAWETTLTLIVRHLINDISASAYTDSRIQQAISVAGLIVAQEFDFNTEYTFDISTPDISPDPTETSTLDTVAMALFSLKAACMLTVNSYQNAIGTGIKVRDGDSEVDTTGSFKGYKDILEIGPCSSYQKLLKERTFRASMNRGKAIMSPFTHEDFMLTGHSSVSRLFDNLSLMR